MPEPADDLAAWGWRDPWPAVLAEHAPAGAEPGRVLRHDGVAVVLALATGTRQVFLAQGGDPVVVGDWVGVLDDRVVTILPRTSLLRRRDAIADEEQPLVANVDVVLVVCGLDRPVKPGRVQRLATLAVDAGAEPTIVLTKGDLVADPADLALIDAELAVAAPGTAVLTVSSVVGTGLDELHAVVQGRTVVLLGESGAGKSTLVNALLGDDVAATGRVRTGDAKGRHTTTARELHLLPDGGVLVDTPGIRAVGVWVEPDAVDATFDDVAELAAGCRFGDCAHGSEPGCAVHAAVANGTLDAGRLAAWHALRAEAVAAEVRLEAQARRRPDRRPGRPRPNDPPPIER